MIKTVSKNDVYISYFKEKFNKDRLTIDSPMDIIINKPTNRLWGLL